jgi:hypothetical protein
VAEVTGATTRQIDQAGDDYTYLLTEALDRVARKVAARWAPGATEDDLATIRTLWAEEIDRTLAPTLALLLHTGAAGVRDQLRGILPVADPETVQAAAEAFHLPGKHDQKRHGHRYRGSRGTVANLKAIYGDKLHVTDLHDPEVQRNIRDFASLPEAHHKLLADHLSKNDWMPSLKDAGIYFGSGPIPNLDKRDDLRHDHPRGWSEGKTWENVPGAYAPDQRQLLVGTGRHGSHSVALHETGHAMDDVLGASSNVKGRYADLHYRAQNAGMAPYFMQAGPAGRQESFGEAYALWAKHRKLVNSEKYRAQELGLGLGLKAADAEPIGRQFLGYFESLDDQIASGAFS